MVEAFFSCVLPSHANGAERIRCMGSEEVSDLRYTALISEWWLKSSLVRSAPDSEVAPLYHLSP